MQMNVVGERANTSVLHAFFNVLQRQFHFVPHFGGKEELKREN
jgi:hypothetical protein